MDVTACTGTIRIQKKKTIKDIGHEEDVVEWPSERREEIEWTTTTRLSKAIERE